MNSLTIGKDGATIDANKVVTGRTCIIGASGSGKSYTVGVICEELCKANAPFALIDTEGEYSTLKDRYDVVRVGDEDGSDERWGAFNVQELAEQAPNAPPLILDVSESPNNGKRMIDAFLSALYKAIDANHSAYLVIVEEADKFIPQIGDSLPIFGEIARRGRKRGLGLMLCTQRPSLVDKDILSQCGNQIIGRLEIRNDLGAVTQFFPGRDLPKQLTTLEAGEFYVMGDISPEPQRVRIRERETRPGGTSPKLEVREIKPLELTSRYVLPTAPLTITLTDNAKASEYSGFIKAIETGSTNVKLSPNIIKSIHVGSGIKVEMKYREKSEVVEAV